LLILINVHVENNVSLPTYFLMLLPSLPAAVIVADEVHLAGCSIVGARWWIVKVLISVRLTEFPGPREVLLRCLGRVSEAVGVHGCHKDSILFAEVWRPAHIQLDP